jgi:hypothetical protein
VQNAFQFAFALVAIGARYTQVTQVIAFCSIVAPAETAFYRAQMKMMKLSMNCSQMK